MSEPKEAPLLGYKLREPQQPDTTLRTAGVLERSPEGREWLRGVLETSEKVLSWFAAHGCGVMEVRQFAEDGRDPELLRALILLAEVEDLVELRDDVGRSVDASKVCKLRDAYVIQLTARGEALVGARRLAQREGSP